VRPYDVSQEEAKTPL